MGNGSWNSGTKHPQFRIIRGALETISIPSDLSFVLSPARPFLALHHHSSQYPVDARLVTGPFDLNQSTNSVSTRNEILRLRGRFQRASAPVSGSTSENKSSSTDARSSMTLRRSRPRFAALLLRLSCMTLSCAHYRDDVVFLQEHSAARWLHSTQT